MKLTKNPSNIEKPWGEVSWEEIKELLLCSPMTRKNDMVEDQEAKGTYLRGAFTVNETSWI